MQSLERHAHLLESLVQHTQSREIMWSTACDPVEGFAVGTDITYISGWKDWAKIQLTQESGDVLYCKVYNEKTADVEIIGIESDAYPVADNNRWMPVITEKLNTLWNAVHGMFLNMDRLFDDIIDSQ